MRALIPLLTILAGIFIIKQSPVWGLAIIVLGLLALIGPFYAASRSKEAKEKSTEKAGDE